MGPFHATSRPTKSTSVVRVPPKPELSQIDDGGIGHHRNLASGANLPERCAVLRESDDGAALCLTCRAEAREDAAGDDASGIFEQTTPTQFAQQRPAASRRRRRPVPRRAACPAPPRLCASSTPPASHGARHGNPRDDRARPRATPPAAATGRSRNGSRARSRGRYLRRPLRTQFLPDGFALPLVGPRWPAGLPEHTPCW